MIKNIKAYFKKVIYNITHWKQIRANKQVVKELGVIFPKYERTNSNKVASFISVKMNKSADHQTGKFCQEPSE